MHFLPHGVGASLTFLAQAAEPQESAMHFWPHGSEWVWILTSGVVTIFLAVLWTRWGWRQGIDDWERQRVLAAAKGVASTAVAFLSTLVLALAKHEIKADLSGLSLLGCVLGVVGAVIYAAAMNISTR